MIGYQEYKNILDENGYVIINNIYSDEEVEKIIESINTSISQVSKPTFRNSDDLYAIRQFFEEVPESELLVFNQLLKGIIGGLFGSDYFLVKSIYFDKPALSNWFVSYHQDLTISVNEKKEVEGFSSWTTKNDRFSVQPPVSILEQNYTIRIHLDNTNNENGALKVIPKSHNAGIYKLETINRDIEKQEICPVERGGIMIMKPLLLHSSGRTTNNSRRRVIHIEFSNQVLPKGLNWSETLKNHD